jgi:hypothetical protein
MLEEISNGLAKHKLIPFFGAGVSAPQLQVLWKGISDEMADLIALPDDQRSDFLKVADDYVAAKGAPALAELLRSRLIAAEFDDVKSWSHLFLLSLNAGVLYTTNQDNLFELGAAKKGRPHRIIVRIEDLAESIPGEYLLIKYHGDLAHPDTVIFTGSSYKARIADAQHFLNIRMRGDLLAKGFLFVGYSFQDPNVRLLFQELRTAFGAVLPASYLIAHRYDPAMEELHHDFGVQIVDPYVAFPDAANHDEAFKRYLKAISGRVLSLQSSTEISNLFTPSTPPIIRVATEFDVATVVADASSGDFSMGLQTYRSLLDRTVIPEGLERDVLDAFKALCDKAQTNNDLAALAAAVFNLSLPPCEALEAISRLMVAVNRVDYTKGFPEFMINSPLHGDAIIPVAAALAVAEIQREGGRINEGFRRHADAWMLPFHQLPPNLQRTVQHAMQVAWQGSGSPPRHLFERSGPFRVKTAGEISADLEELLPRMLQRPRS